MAPSPRRRHNKWVFLSFFHLVTLCFIPPNKRVDPRALRPSLPPSIHAWIALRPPNCLMGGCSNKTMHSNGRTPTQKEAEAFVRPPRPRPAGHRHHLNQWCIWPSPRPSLRSLRRCPA